MTIKERIQALFKKQVKPHPFVKFEKKEISLEDLEEELEIDDDIKEEFELWDAADDCRDILNKALEKETMVDLEAEFQRQYPTKKAIWGGKETKAFIKFKEDMGK